jgi:RelA/SpoT family (p)ppGpp synthetase
MATATDLRLVDVLGAARPALTDDGARQLLERAYALAEKAHSGQRRRSGEPYLHHPVAVAHLLAEIGMDPDTIAAGLLHDVVEESGVSVHEIERAFGADIASLVDGVTKLEHLDRFRSKGGKQRDEQESESLRKMFLAMADDVRVVMIKLADRLHNMRTLRALDPQRQRSFARETLDIFAPLANRLGLWQWKWQLEDLSLRHLDPEAYEEIATLVEEKRAEREAEIERCIEELAQRLEAEGIEADITGRPKHIYSIYGKMERKGVPFGQVHDVRGIRVIAQDVSECYRVLGLVHSLWKPIPGEFDDYIATPKPNLYQSLHTAVVTSDGGTLEVQIRTHEMHRTAEFGVAAHWRYKEGGKRDEDFEAKMAWMRSLLELRTDAPDAEEFVDAMKTDVFQDRVYAFTPKGKLIDLPVGVTPIDFAYHVHTEIGHRCRGARVNGKLVSLSYRLKSGDQVEILTARRGGPSRDWLNPALGYVRTSRARTKMRQWFRRQDRELNVAQGREVVDRELKRLGLEHLGHERVARLLGFEELDDFHAAVGFGDVNSQQIAGKIAESRPREDDRLPLAPLPPPSIEGIQVQGTGGLLTRLGRCCNPLPGDDIIGYVTRGRGVTIHRRDCPSVLRQSETDRLIEVSWGQRPQTVPVTIYITAYDRTRLLSEISGLIGEEDINIASVQQDISRNIARFYITIEVNDIAQLSRVLTKIERLPNVISSRRHTG